MLILFTLKTLFIVPQKNNLSDFSRIIADFELKNIYEELIIYIFMEKRNYSNKQFCNSFIHDNTIDYIYGQTKMTLLYKEKINKKTGENALKMRVYVTFLK